MPRSIEERLAVVEERLEGLLERIDSGPRVPWEKSIRGRLHAVKDTLDNADQLARALREVRRERRNRWSKGQKVALFCFAAAGAVAPYVALYVKTKHG